MLAAFVPVLVALTTLSLLSTTSFFFFNATATPEIYTLSLHDALPISFLTAEQHRQLYDWIDASLFQTEPEYYDSFRSEEHTSELQSRFDLVCRLLLEKKKRFTELTSLSSCRKR